MPPNVPPRIPTPTDRRVEDLERRLTALESVIDEQSIIKIHRDLAEAQRDRAVMTDRVEALEREDRTMRRKVASLHDVDDDDLFTKTGSHRIELVTKAAIAVEMEKERLRRDNESMRVRLTTYQQQDKRAEQQQDAHETLKLTTAHKIVLLFVAAAISVGSAVAAKECGVPSTSVIVPAAPEQHSH